jgi:hypothetical protein
MSPTLQPQPDAKRRLNLALINQLGYPGVGTVLAGKKIGYTQAALMTLGLAISLIYFYKILQELVPVLAQMNTLSQDELLALYKPHAWIGQTGFAVSLASWIWSLFSTIAILTQTSNLPHQPPCPK